MTVNKRQGKCCVSHVKSTLKTKGRFWSVFACYTYELMPKIIAAKFWDSELWDARAGKIAAFFILIHCFIWTLLPTIFFPTVQLDTAEGLMWGLQWQWGYYKHPFLAPWATALGNFLGNGAPGFGVYFASQVFYAFCFWGVWKCARLFLSPLLALAALMLLEGIHFYNFESTQLDPNVAMLPFWVWSTYFFYHATRKNFLRDWVICGILIGLGFMAKYETFVLVIPMLIFMLWNGDARKSFRHSGIYFAISICILICLPNAIWVIQHQYLPITYIFSETNNAAQLGFFAKRFVHTGYYLFEQVLNLAPILILFIPFYSMQVESQKTDVFDRQFLWIVAIGAPLFTLFMAITIGIDVRGQWSLPFFSLLGVVILYEWRPHISTSALKSFSILVFSFLFLIAAGTMIGVNLFPYIKHRPTQKQFPAAAVANFVTSQWHVLYHTPLSFVASDRGILSYTAAYSSDHPKPIIDFDVSDSPWLTQKDICTQGAAFLWRTGDGESEQAARAIFSDKKWKNRTQKSFPYLTKVPLPPIEITLVFLPPHSC